MRLSTRRSGHHAIMDSGNEAHFTMSRRDFVAGTAAAAGAHAVGTPARAATPPQQTAAGTDLAISLTVNGAKHDLSLDPRVTLLDALRDHLALTGTKKGCDQGTCGACTVLVNGRRIDSCLTLAVMHGEDTITTIEGIAHGGELHPVQQAFIERDGFQCGYCTPGQVVSAVGMLAEGHALDRDTIRTQMSGNICRCGCYAHIVDAISDAGRRA